MFYCFPNFYRQLLIVKFSFPHKVTSRYENKAKVKLNINIKQNYPEACFKELRIFKSLTFIPTQAILTSL